MSDEVHRRFGKGTANNGYIPRGGVCSLVRLLIVLDIGRVSRYPSLGVLF